MNSERKAARRTAHKPARIPSGGHTMDSSSGGLQ
jgi:hypothetical protein